MTGSNVRGKVDKDLRGKVYKDLSLTCIIPGEALAAPEASFRKASSALISGGDAAASSTLFVGAEPSAAERPGERFNLLLPMTRRCYFLCSTDLWRGWPDLSVDGRRNSATNTGQAV